MHHSVCFTGAGGKDIMEVDIDVLGGWRGSFVVGFVVS